MRRARWRLHVACALLCSTASTLCPPPTKTCARTGETQLTKVAAGRPRESPPVAGRQLPRRPPLSAERQQSELLSHFEASLAVRSQTCLRTGKCIVKVPALRYGGAPTPPLSKLRSKIPKMLNRAAHEPRMSRARAAREPRTSRARANACKRAFCKSKNSQKH